jgi:hypothetical protein
MAWLPSFLNRSDPVIDEYRLFREHTARRQNAAVSILDPDAFREAARRLGMMKKKAIVLGSESEMNVIIDFAVYSIRHKGRTATERQLEEDPPETGSVDELACNAMRNSRYRLLLIEKVERGKGLRVVSVLDQERLQIVDLAFSVSAFPGLMLAGRLLEFPNFYSCTGASLPLTEPQLRPIQRVIQHPEFARYYELCDRGDFRAADFMLSSKVLSICLQTSAGDRIAHIDVNLPPQEWSCEVASHASRGSAGSRKGWGLHSK